MAPLRARRSAAPERQAEDAGWRPLRRRPLLHKALRCLDDAAMQGSHHDGAGRG